MYLIEIIHKDSLYHPLNISPLMHVTCDLIDLLVTMVWNPLSVLHYEEHEDSDICHSVINHTDDRESGRLPRSPSHSFTAAWHAS